MNTTQAARDSLAPVVKTKNPEAATSTSGPNWQPQWTVDTGPKGDTLGIAVDDGCFVVLYPHEGGWRPGKHIPRAVAERMAELLEFASND